MGIASQAGGTVLFQLAWLVWAGGAGMFAGEAIKACGAKTPRVPLFKDRQVIASVCLVVGAVFYIFGCFFYYSHSSRMGGVGIFFTASWFLVAGGFTLVYDSIKVNEGALVLEDRLTMGALLFAVASFFLWLGSIFLMKSSSHQAGVASYLVASIIYTIGSTMFYLEVSNASYSDAEGAHRPLSAGSAPYSKPYAPTMAAPPAGAASPASRPAASQQLDEDDDPFL